MSRFVKIIDDKEYVWGFDIPLQEYFFQCFDASCRKKKDDEEVIFSIASRFSEKPHPNTPDKEDYSNGQILEIIQYEESQVGREIVPQEHKNSISMDLMF